MRSVGFRYHHRSGFPGGRAERGQHGAQPDRLPLLQPVNGLLYNAIIEILHACSTKTAGDALPVLCLMGCDNTSNLRNILRAPCANLLTTS